MQGIEGKPIRITVNLDKPRAVVLNNNTFAVTERETGFSLIDEPERLRGILGMRSLLWAGLNEAARLDREDGINSPPIGLEDVGILLTMERFPEVSDQLGEGVIEFFPKPEENSDSPLGKEAEDGTG